MICFECAKSGARREAAALCHHCSAALCLDHARTVEDPIRSIAAICKPVVLPKHARLVLCDTCLAALEQAHQDSGVTAE